jgi:hypothetical protein
MNFTNATRIAQGPRATLTIRPMKNGFMPESGRKKTARFASGGFLIGRRTTRPSR